MPRSAATRLTPSVPRLSYEHEDDKIIKDEVVKTPQDTRTTEKSQWHQKTMPPSSSKDPVSTHSSIPASYVAVGVLSSLAFVIITLSLGAAGAAIVLRRQKGHIPVVHINPMYYTYIHVILTVLQATMERLPSSHGSSQGSPPVSRHSQQSSHHSFNQGEEESFSSTG